MPRDIDRHQCPISGCKELIAGFMCRRHFRMFPADMGFAIRHARSAGRPLQEKEAEAIAAVEARLAEGKAR